MGPLVNAAGFLGHAARMVLFSMVGIFFVRAAWQYDSKEAIGIDEALAKLAHRPHGPVWLGAAAVGLFACSVFSLLSARYREILNRLRARRARSRRRSRRCRSGTRTARSGRATT